MEGPPKIKDTFHVINYNYLIFRRLQITAWKVSGRDNQKHSVKHIGKEKGVTGDRFAGVSAGAGGNKVRYPLRFLLSTSHFYE